MKQKDPISRERRKPGRKLLAAVLSLAMILTLANPTTVFAAEKDGTEKSGSFWGNAIESIADFFGFGDDDGTDTDVQTRTATAAATLTADGDTKDAYSIDDETSTRYNGRVWVDKSVSAEKSVDFGTAGTVTNNSDFLVTYSALATSTNIIGQTPTDTVFILDLSASMTWGYRDSGKSVPQENSRLQAMVDSMNSAIDTLVKANSQNRIAIVTFNGSCQEKQALIPELMTGADILAQVKDGRYLDIQNYNQNLGDDPEKNKDKATADIYCYATNRKASTSGGTNIQAGLFRGMGILADTKDTTANVNGTTVTRVPNVILMSDGAPTTFSSSENASYVYHRYDNGDDQEYPDGTIVEGVITTDSAVLRDGNNDVYSGDWWKTNSGQQIGAGNNNNPDSADGFMALLTASYFKNAISNNYYPDSNEEANVYTIGFGTDVQNDAMVAMANLVLNPEENLGVDTSYDQVDEVSTAWETYQEGRTPTVHAPIGDGSNTLHIPFVVSQCDSENNPTSLDYPTRHYAAADDEELNQIFTEIATLITSQASAPTEVTGDPLNDGYITYTDTTGKYMEIKDVTTLIFMNQKLKVTKDDSQSNDTVTTYVADSYTYENPAYPGGSYNTNQIKITVTDNTDNTQTIKVEIPAALIPLRVNTITLAGNGNPMNSTSTGNLPLRLCYEVGLEDGIDTTTLDGVDESYISANTENGKVNFYSNAYDKNSTEVDKGVGATVTFEAAPTNPFYFVQEDTPLYLRTGTGAGGNPTYERATEAFDESITYYFPVTYYTGDGEDVQEATTYVARSGDTLAGYVSSDAEGLYIIAGSPRIGNLEDVTAAKDTENNKTGTYGNYREPTFIYDDDSSQNPQEGHFLVLLGNNGKLQLNVPATLTIAKAVTADQGLTAPDKNFTFDLTVPSKAGKTVTAVLYTTNAANQQVTLVFDNDGKAQIQNGDDSKSEITLAGGQSLEIPGMGNVQYTVAEQNAQDNDGFDLKDIVVTGDNSAETKNATASGTVSTSDTTVTFTNNYSATGETTLTGTKTITGRDFQKGDEFTFSITGEYTGSVQGTTAPMPANVKDGKITINPESGKSADINFGEISFTQPGTYVYTISEDDVDTDKVPAVSKDNTVYTVTYTVEDKNNNGELTVSAPTYAINGAEPDSEAPTSLTWENTYTPESDTFDPDGDIKPNITKQILGYDAAAQSPEGYTFELSVKNTTSGAAQDSGFTLPTPATATSDKDGDINFDPITFTAEGTYEITIAEQIPESGNPNMIYDGHKLVYTVSVADDHKGSLVATVDEDSISEGETTFRNVLTPKDEKSVYSADDLETEINGQLVGVGDKLTYTIDWVNNAQDSSGAPTSATVTVTDTIPEGTRLVEGTISKHGSLGQDGRTITWTFENQDAGAAGQVNYTVEVTEDAVKITNPENTVTNTAQIQVGENNPAQNTNTVENPVPEKTETTNASEVTEGTELTYQIAFKNTAGDNGTAAVVDELTKGQEYVAGSTSITVNGGEASATEPTVEGTAADGQKLTWNLSGLAADAQVVLTFDVTITRDAGATVDNTATVNGHKTNVVTTPYPSESTKDVSYADEPEVSINGQMVGVGDELLYTIDWAAEADGELTVTDTIPTGTTYVSGSADNSGSYDEKSNMITWNLGQHSEGDKGTVTFKVTVNDNAVQNDGNAIRNRAEILIGTDNPSYTTDVTNYVPEKSVIDNDPSTDGTQVGDTLTYTIQYANAGDEPVDMVITDTLDEGLTYVPYSAGENAEYDADTRTITWTLNDVPANTMDGQVSFQAVVNEKAEGQTIENEAQITVGDNPQITTNKTETEVKTGSLTISKTVTVNTDQGTTIDTEKEFTFTVVLTDKKGNQLDGEYSYSGTSDGTTEYQGTITSTGTIKLKHEGRVTITGLPEGAEYTVTETPETGYTAENAELKGAIPADSAATAAFVNNYSAGQATLNGATNLEVTKEFTGKDWGDEVFTFTLTQTGGDTTKVTLPDNADNLQIGKDTKDHKAAFGDIIFTAAGEYTFEISEVIPENPGQIHYDDHKATITVNVTDNKSGDLVAVASATTSGSMTFKNTYTPQEITANIQALKTMSGRDLRDTDDFTFTITPQNGAPATTRPEAHNGGQDNAVIDFGTATFTEAGTYTYLITETGGNVAGVTNSTQTITATVQVDYNEATGTLSSEVSYSGGDGDAGNMFTNVYQAAPVVPAEFETGITGTKTVTASEGNSYTMQGGEFSFTLTPAASNPSTDPVEETTITNGADGSLVFVSGPVTYTESGTYTYTVRENDSSEGGITEDGSLYTIVVEVTDSGDGQLAADVSISKDGNVTDAITFDNSYDPAKTGVTISGTKELTGKNIENNMFTFRITGDNDAPMPSATEVQNVGSSFAFGTIEYTEPGTYVYHISEVNDGKTGYTYDGTVYDVTVVVTDTDGALHADVSGADAIVFKNSYDPGQVTLTGETALRAHKTLTGRELNAEEFVFEVKDADGNVLTTGTNDADGNVVFGDLTFDQTGTYNYTISERNDSLGGITYDGTIYTVQIDVTDAGGYLEAAVQYFEGNTQTDLPEFENEYTAASTGVSLGASKILTGRDLKDGEFTFVLKDADGNTVDEAVNDANGSVKFDEITYDQAGTYRYTVSEVKGDDTTITYDETVYDVTVEVADNGSGTLVPTVTIGNGDSQGIVFTNEYNEPENPTPGNEDTPDDKTPDKKPDNGGTTQSTDKGNVQTGDTAQFMPVVAALLASLLAVIAIAVVMIRRRRR